MYFSVVSFLGSCHEYSSRPIVKTIGTEANHDSDVLPFAVLQEVFRMVVPKDEKKPLNQNKVNYLKGSRRNYYAEHRYFYPQRSNADYTIHPYGENIYVLVDKEGDAIIDLQYVKNKGKPTITKVEFVASGNRFQEHVFLETKKMRNRDYTFFSFR